MTTDQRLARLERENRWMKACAVALAIGLTTLLIGAMKNQPQEKRQEKIIKADRIEAKVISVCDEEGRHRIILGVRGGPVISLIDEKETMRAILAYAEKKNLPYLLMLDGQGPRLEIGCQVAKSYVKLMDKGGTTRTALASVPRCSGIEVFDAKGVKRAGMFEQDGAATVRVLDDHGRERSALLCVKDEAVLTFDDRYEKKNRIWIGTSKRSAGVVVTDGGKARVGLRMNDKEPLIEVTDGGGTPRVSAGCNALGIGYIVVKDESGRTLARMPN